MTVTMIFKYAAVGVAFASLTACGPEKWTAFYYPNAKDLTINAVLGQFASLDACRADALAEVSRSGGAYECGLNCNFNMGPPYMCDTTAQ